MPFFFKTDSYVIVERQHEVNAEVLDSRIELLPDGEHIYIVAHHPNKQWSYNVGWIEEGPVSKLWERVNALGRKQKTDKPHLFYEAIPKRFFKDYKKLFKFQDLITTGDLKKQKKPATEPQPNIMDFKNKKSIAAQPTQKSNSNSGDPKLQYPNERATHTYKSPNKR